jgi:hypothetical protein
MLTWDRASLKQEGGEHRYDAANSRYAANPPLSEAIAPEPVWPFKPKEPAAEPIYMGERYDDDEREPFDDPAAPEHSWRFRH